ncbi:septal ring lytic transglycosylase RlpA family protein [Micromonospora humidisoli]|uniref:septal ring lytic transglycosylase RlpA family protein n=1 Tax=Micromonospora humidisoli TaxID=2807622 RepID=UPI001EF70235|nr:septal ring lytic transglycosylase RlpA family protein [Micromonospora humidisoli]
MATTGDVVKVQRKHVLAAGVAVVATAVVAVGTGFGFADTTSARPSLCSGSVTFSAEGGEPAATSDRFPVGTRLRVTNLDNGKVATVSVSGPSGSCVLLNAAAMELVREPGKNVIRRNVVERVGADVPAAPDPGETRPGAAQPPAAQPSATGLTALPAACTGSVTFSAETGAPAATSDRFPVGTRLRVTNLDNGKVATVSVSGPSGSCVLLNAAAMELLREPGKNVIRRNLVELVR